MTRRERDVLDGIGRRLTNAEIAEELNLSKRTVESHVSSLLAKSGASDRRALVRIAHDAVLGAGTAPVPLVAPRRAGWTGEDGPPRSPTVGREVELAGLRDDLAVLESGRGGLITLAGEPGIGKTRLAEELVATAGRRGVRWLVGHCEEADGSPPFVPVVEVLAAALARGRPLGRRVHPARP